MKPAELERKMRFATAIVTFLLVALSPALFAQEDVVMRAVRDEMERSKTQLHLEGMEKPYYIEYIIDDTSLTTISATLGVLTGNNTEVGRTLTLQVRVGDYAFDNTNFLAVQSFGGGMGMLHLRRALPLDDDYDQIRREIWLATDGAYKRSAGGIAAKRSVLQTRKYSDNIPDFTPHKAISRVETRIEVKFERANLEKLVREVSAVFRGTPEIIDSAVDLLVRNVYSRYVNSEGTSFTRAEPVLGLRVRAHTRAADGLPLEDSFAVYGRGIDAFRTAELVERAKGMAARLLKLRQAGSIDRYNGPVLFEGEAAGGVLSDVFAPAVAAARFPLTDEPQFEMAITQMLGQMGGTGLTEKLGGRVMPEFLDVVDRPHQDSFEGTPLLGTRTIDDEGVLTQDVNIVQGGILSSVLATRTPTVEAKASTGSKGLFGAVSSNLFITAKKTETPEQLRLHLLRLAKARGYDYGVVVRHAAEAGFSWMVRFAGKMGAPGVPSTTSTEIYKLFADGREEPVRGVEITSLTATSFKDIVAVGDKPVVYHGPHIPTMNAIFSGFGGGNLTGDVLALGSFVAPAILFEEISLKRANIPAPNPPVVPSPLPAFSHP